MMDDERRDEHTLSGGNFDTGVVRIGDTVHRAAGPWTPAVHALLTHLQSEGFDAAPTVLGMDELAREVLSYLDGEPGHYPLDDFVRSDEALVDAARLLRSFHDVTLSFEAPRDAVWRQGSADPGPIEVVCHSDWAPYNAIFRDGHLAGMIDWDFARPGSRLWDIAWMAHTWVPLRDDAGAIAQGWPSPPDRGRRLRLVCDAYGLENRGDVLGAIWARVLGMAEWLEAGAARNETVFMRLVQEGHAVGYRRALSYMDEVWEELARALA